MSSERFTVGGIPIWITRPNTHDFISFGLAYSTVASTGDIRTGNASTILAAVTSGGSDMAIIATDASNNITLGDPTNSNTITVKCAQNFSVNASGAVYLDGSSLNIRDASHSAYLSVDPASLTAASASAGSSGAVPAQVVGYLIVTISGTARKIPYFAT